MIYPINNKYGDDISMFSGSANGKMNVIFRKRQKRLIEVKNLNNSISLN